MWPQVVSDYVLDNNYFGNEKDISEIYNVDAIPLYILIDIQGKIIGKWHNIGDIEINEINQMIQTQ